MVFFYFLPFHRLLFILLIISFVCKSFYFWCNPICFSSYFCCLCFWSHIPNSCPRSMPRNFLSFSSSLLAVLQFQVIHLSHLFQVEFCIWWETKIQFYLFLCGNSVFTEWLTEGNVLYPLSGFGTDFEDQFSSVQLLSHVQLFVTQWTAARQASRSITNSQSLPKLMSIELVMPSNHLILCRPLLLPPSIFPNIRVFSNESALPIRWAKYWNFSFNISPSNEHQDWFDLGWTDWISLQSKGLSSIFSNTIVQKHQFFWAQLSSQSNSHTHTWPLQKP